MGTLLFVKCFNDFYYFCFYGILDVVRLLNDGVRTLSIWLET